MEITGSLLLFGLIVAVLFVFGPRPKLNPTVQTTLVPQNLAPAELASWLTEYEEAHQGIIGGAEAKIHWADEPAVTDICLLYIHGFSASRQETAPVTERVGAGLNANVVYTRLAGHGLESDGMEAAAEDWLQSVTDSWEIASRIGRRVVIVAVSTGAPLAVWLSQLVTNRELVHSLVFLSPNFRVRSPFGFILTWPWSRYWVPLLLGRERSWEPENELADRYWTSRYSIHAVIEMQKVVDWVKHNPPISHNIPLATIYMTGDPTISHEAAVNFHHAWDASTKELLEVTIDRENPQHVFAGDITAPHRVDWCVDACVDFLRLVDEG
ncbi:MAG: hypothetical protein HOC70_10850 [Gammaproteobacteria bacterium]|jgi:esterase/lipase|nr:hypothetical protein [Gammaproteobacteria bacterium]MBT4493732.1 hypothetical protein [Gammaproteobacteria bacterium]MBT7372097.1 hypothetical protein [Gammaproteobacteria bacterium]